MIRKIVRSGDPRLREICKPVTKIDEKVLKVVRDLKDTLAIQKDPEGVGLAAPQIGKNLSIFAIRYKNLERIVINPKIIEEPKTKSKTKKEAGREILEGCLSLPNYYSSLERGQNVTIRYQNEKGEIVTEEFKGFYAQIVLHEIDHLNGVLFLDRLLEQKKALFKLSGDKWEEVELV